MKSKRFWVYPLSGDLPGAQARRPGAVGTGLIAWVGIYLHEHFAARLAIQHKAVFVTNG